MATPGPALCEMGRTAAAALVVVAFCCTLLIHDPQWFWADDYQSYQLANYRDLARAWQAGEFPLLSPYSWQSGALAAEYQNGVFSVAITALVLIVFSLDLSLTNAATALVLTHLAILAMGSFRLGRRRGLPSDLAAMAALATSLSGWMMIWGAKSWFPALASFAWFPWFWWALDRAHDDKDNVTKIVIAGIFLYLIITAGWPFTVLMAMLLSAWMVLRSRVQCSRWRISWPLMGAWAIGLGLSAPAWMMLLEYAPETFRSKTHVNNWTNIWIVPLTSLPGLVFPAHTTNWNTFGYVKAHMNAELAGSLVPLAAIVACGIAGGRNAFRKLGWEIGLCLAVLFLAMFPSPGSFRWSFRWLPMFALLLSLIGGDCLANWRASRRKTWSAPSVWACVLVIGALLLAVPNASDAITHGSVLLGICVLWAIIERQCASGSALRTWAPSMVVLVSCWLTYAFAGPYLEVPAWPDAVAECPQQLDPKVRYLSSYDWNDVFESDRTSLTWPLAARPTFLWTGNYSLYAGVEFINGYSPMQPLALTTLFGFHSQGYLDENFDAEFRLMAAETGPGDLLDLMGVNGLIVSTRYSRLLPILEAKGWNCDATLADCYVLHRRASSRVAAKSLDSATITRHWDRAIDTIRNRKPSNLGWVLFDRKETSEPNELESHKFAHAEIALREERRNSVTIHVSNTDKDRGSLIAFSRSWYPGYRALFNGRAIPVERLNLLMPAVRLPAGESGVLVLEYRPDSLIRGASLAFITIVSAIVASIVAQRRSKRHNEHFVAGAA